MQTVHIMASRTGSPTVRVGNVQIHSRYDPYKEAHRLIDNTVGQRIPSAVVIIGAGLGYGIGALIERYPTLKIVALCLHSQLFRNTLFRCDFHWHPDHPASPEQFLRNALNGQEILDIVVINQNPPRLAFPELHRRIERAVRDTIRELGAGITTVGLFGRRWLCNAFANFLLLQRFVVPSPCKRPVVIVASGPSLEQSIDDVIRLDTCCDVWALPSALPMLKQARVHPDLIIATDGGHYAREHMECMRDTPVTIATTLTAARGMWCDNWSIVLLNQNFGPEADLCQTLQVPTVALPPNGTVAGSALELAIALRAPAVVFAGFDLCARDIRIHARPHAFTHWLWNNESRLSSVHARSWQRIATYTRLPDSATPVPPGHETYASWIRQRIRTCPMPVYRLHPSVVDLQIPPIEITALLDMLQRMTVVSATNPAPTIIPPSGRSASVVAPATRHGSPPATRHGSPPDDRTRHWGALIARWQAQCASASAAEWQTDHHLSDIALAIDASLYLRFLRAIRGHGDPPERLRRRLADRIDDFFDASLRRYIRTENETVQ